MKSIVLYIMFIISFLDFKNGVAQNKFDYTVRKNVEGIVIYKIEFDSSMKVYDYGKQLGILYASNVYIDGTYYPLSYIEHIRDYDGMKYDTLYGPNYQKLLSFRNSIEPDNFSESVCFSDSSHFYQSVDSNAQFYYGGEQYVKKDEETEKYKMEGIKVFYISFKFNADLLYVWEGNFDPYYMGKWACSDSYNYTKGSSNPTLFLLKKYKCSSLSSREQKMLGLIPVTKFGYYYTECY